MPRGGPSYFVKAEWDGEVTAWAAQCENLPGRVGLGSLTGRLG